jgi:NAD(P)-dependent dehydrogenase (short-subunit alcohol dehydrogenase family)
MGGWCPIVDAPAICEVARMSLPDQTGKNAIVTGANTGIGRVTAVELARAGARVWLACRSKEKTRPVLDEIAELGGKADFLPLDLAELASVRAAAEAFLATGAPLHLLVNNAGLASQRGVTKDGFEQTFGVNHLGHYLFTLLLLDRIKQSAPARIVNVASTVHHRARSIPWDRLREKTRTITGLDEYGVSKLCNVLFTRELARRLAGTGVTTYAVHPGGVASDIYRRIPWPIRPLVLMTMKSTTEGAATSLWCATAPELAGESGGYYADRKPKHPSRVAQDDALAAELWKRSAEWTGLPG